MYEIALFSLLKHICRYLQMWITFIKIQKAHDNQNNIFYYVFCFIFMSKSLGVYISKRIICFGLYGKRDV